MDALSPVVREQYDELVAVLASTASGGHSVSPLSLDGATGAATFSVLTNVDAATSAGGGGSGGGVRWPLAFVHGMRLLADRFGVDPVLEVSFVVPPVFPLAPPEVRLLRPLLEEGTGGVINGALLLPALLPAGWSPQFSLAAAVSFVHDHLAHGGAAVDAHGGAAVDAHAPAFYCVQAFRATQDRLATATAASAAACAHPHAFVRRMVAYSSRFAQRVMGLRVPPAFEAGNRVLAPVALLELLARGETEALVAAAAAGAGGGAGSGARGRFDSVDDDASFSEAAAMTFAVTGALGVAAYVGVADFCVPHADVLVLPATTLAALGGVGDGCEVTLTRVRLPPVTSITLQPHAADFLAAFEDDDAAGVGGGGLAGQREFLEAALTRHVSLQAGDVIVCDAGGLLLLPPRSNSTAQAGGGADGGSGEWGAAGPGAQLLADANGDVDEETALALAASASEADAAAAAAGGTGGVGGGANPPGAEAIPPPPPAAAAGVDGDDLAAVDDDVLAALLAAGVSADELSQGVALASSHERRVSGRFPAPATARAAADDAAAVAAVGSTAGSGSGAGKLQAAAAARITAAAVDTAAAAAAAATPPPRNTAFRFTVIAVEPSGLPAAPAVALWQAFSAQVAIDLLPASDEFLVPVAAAAEGAAAAAAEAAQAPAAFGADAAAASVPPVGVWRPLPAEVADSASPVADAAAGGGGGGGGHRLGSAADYDGSSGGGGGRAGSPSLAAAAPAAAARLNAHYHHGRISLPPVPVGARTAAAAVAAPAPAAAVTSAATPAPGGGASADADDRLARRRAAAEAAERRRLQAPADGGGASE
jgi:trimeric autotransporter adhesin